MDRAWLKGSVLELKDYVLFWGCTIPARLPFLEKSLRMVMDRLGIRYREIEGFTCCPEKFLVETLSEETWLLTAARNLALAEAAGGDMLVACNGCYSTFRSAIGALHASSELRSEIMGRLAAVGIDFSLKVSVHHVLEVMHDAIGPDVINRKVEWSLNGMCVATHYGCQLVRPSPTVRLDNPLSPMKLDRMVECLGATSIDYHSKPLCCGESLSRAGNPDESLASARIKLHELWELGADALVVTCPACFIQFDSQQSLVRKDLEELEMPVFYLSELVGYALGLDPGEMGFDMHRVPVDGFFSKRDELQRLREMIPEGFDYEAIRTCVSCESCLNDCPVVQVDEEYVPHDILREVLAGRVDAVIEGEGIWKCLECGTCTELCPNSFGMMKVFKRAKRMALQRGLGPAETVQGIEMFNRSAVLGKTRERARSKLGLGPVAESGAEELAQLLKCADEWKDDG